jgi:RNase P subunit RPR2
MTGKDLLVSPAVAAFLAARSPGWQHRVRVGKSGGRSVPVPCEVCGRITYHPVVELEYRARHGRSLPRFCSNRCQRVGNARARAGGVPAAVERFLAARLPDWRDRARIGACGGKACANAASREYYGRGPLPPPPPKWVSLRCEVCGGEMRYRRSEIEGRQRRGMPLPRFCSRRCAMLARHRPAAEA